MVDIKTIELRGVEKCMQGGIILDCVAIALLHPQNRGFQCIKQGLFVPCKSALFWEVRLFL